MRQIAAAARTVKRSTKGLPRSACKRYPVDPLSLPRFSKDVSGNYIPRTENKKWGQLALRLLDAGILREGDAAAAHSEQALVELALSRWSLETTGPLDNLTSLEMIVSVDAAAMDFDEKFSEEEDSTNCWYWALNADGVEVFTLKEKFTALDAICPGLAETALHWLTKASRQTLAALTPETTRDLAENIWWYGASNDQDFIEEIEMMNGEEYDPEDLDCKPSWYDGHFPKNLLAPNAVLDRPALEMLARQEGEIGEIARAVIHITDLLKQGVSFPDMCGCAAESVYYSAILQWEKEDPVMQVYDDFINNANQCGDGYTSWVGVDSAQLDAKGFSKLKTLAENGLRLLGLVNTLVGLLGSPS